jgi:hypothetical protein
MQADVERTVIFSCKPEMRYSTELDFSSAVVDG